MVSFHLMTYEKIELEINSNKQWVLYRNGKSYIIENYDDSYFLLPLIELEKLDVLKKLIKEYKKSNSKIVTHPNTLYLNLIKYCLISNSHWGKTAVSKLSYKDIDQELRFIIEVIIKEKKYDQKSRHQLFKLMKQSER